MENLKIPLHYRSYPELYSVYSLNNQPFCLFSIKGVLHIVLMSNVIYLPMS